MSRDSAANTERFSSFYLSFNSGTSVNKLVDAHTSGLVAAVCIV